MNNPIYQNYNKFHYSQVNNINNDNLLYKIVKAEIIPYLKNKHVKILDVGCGTGDILKTLKSFGYKNLFGIEISKDQYIKAKKINGIDVIHGDAYNFLQKSGKKFDVLIMFDLIEHIEKKKLVSFLKFAHKTLNKNGILIIRTPNAKVPFSASYYRYIDFTHTNSFTDESLSFVLLLSKFKDIKVSNTKIVNQNFFYIIAKIARFLLDPLVKLVLSLYYGPSAFRFILSPNLIAIAKK